MANQIHSFRLIDSRGVIHTASATENKDLFDAGRVGVGALGIITTITLKAEPLWKMKKTTLSYSFSQLMTDLPTLLTTYERLQWSWTPYTDSASVLIREDVPLDTPLVPASPDGGCWSTTQSTTNCTDLSYKTLTDSEARYAAREIYTEMEMFIPAEHVQAAVKDFVAFMDSIRSQHDESIVLSAMVRYVKGDDILLSPAYGRDTAVMSFIALGDSEKTADYNEFERYARGLEELCERKYQGRPHWGKVNYAVSSYLQTAYNETFSKFNAVRKSVDPSGMFMNDYLRQRL
jgi:L-gulonolactone oxidase